MPAKWTRQIRNPQSADPQFENLDAFRPLAERAPEPQVAEAQRREFFAQMHRWLRQEYSVNIFSNNAGERQRFEEIWQELVGQASRLSSSPMSDEKLPQKPDRQMPVLLSTSARSLAASSATRRNSLLSRTRKFLAVIKSSGRADRNPRTRSPRAPRSTLTSRIWRKAIWWCICSTASGVISA